MGVLRLGKMLDEKGKPNYELKPYLKSKNIGWLKLKVDDVSEMYFNNIEMRQLRLHKGDLLFSEGGEVGKTSIWENELCECYIQNSVHKLTLKKDILPRYILYYSYLYGILGYYDSLVNLVSIKHLTFEKIRRVEFKIPPLTIQQRIVDYLDSKLSEIDKRVSVLEKQQDAYARLKKSIIHQAVTRGLNPDVRLKDSGIEWIGMIPEHWEIKRFKDLFSKYTTGLTPESKVEENFTDDERFTWITIGDMTSRIVTDSSMCLSEKVIKEKSPILSPKGSLLFSFKLSIGKTAFAGKDLYTNEAIVTIPPRKNIELNYFFYLIPYVCINNATENIYGAKMLNQKIIANMLFAIPSYQEQCAIAIYLDEKCAKIDAAIENIGKQIEASKRLKRAIINEAISGKTTI